VASTANETWAWGADLVDAEAVFERNFVHRGTVYGSSGEGFDHNALIPRSSPACAYWTFGSFACAEKDVICHPQVSVSRLFRSGLTRPWRLL
jgi:hypothetical protein